MENLLISACLLGVQCRYDGGSKPVMPTVALMEQYHLIPICPEQLGGLPTPREPSERRADAVVTKSGADVTAQFRRGAEQALHLARLYGCTVIVLGRGSQGAAIYLRQTGEIYELPAVHTGPVVNTAGAGDALFSAFVHYYAGGVPPLEALARAQVFASVKIGVSGAAKGFVDETTVEALYRAAAGR